MSSTGQPYLGDRLHLPHLRGEVTTIAGVLADVVDCTPREQAAAWVCGAMEEAAAVLRATLDMPADDRARLIAELETAAETLHQAEAGGRP